MLQGGTSKRRNATQGCSVVCNYFGSSSVSYSKLQRHRKRRCRSRTAQQMWCDLICSGVSRRLDLRLRCGFFGALVKLLQPLPSALDRADTTFRTSVSSFGQTDSQLGHADWSSIATAGRFGHSFRRFGMSGGQLELSGGQNGVPDCSHGVAGSVFGNTSCTVCRSATASGASDNCHNADGNSRPRNFNQETRNVGGQENFSRGFLVSGFLIQSRCTRMAWRKVGRKGRSGSECNAKPRSGIGN